MEHFVTPYDFTKIEERLLASYCGIDPMLPRKHPLRFALLYSPGPVTVERLLLAFGPAARLACLSRHVLAPDWTPTQIKSYKALRQEVAIQMFEYWAANANQDVRDRLEAENRVIQAAAQAAGIIPRSSAPVATQPNVSPTGRLCQSTPTPQRWEPDPKHPYPEGGILRD